MAQANAFQTLPANSSAPLVVGLTNANAIQQTIYPGSFVTLYGQNLVNAQVTLNDVSMPVSFSSGFQINFSIPSNFPTGLAVLKVSNGGVQAAPILLQVDVPPPTIVSVTNASGVPFDANHFASALDVVNIQVANLDPTVVNNPSRVQVSLGSLLIPPTISPAGNGLFQLQFVVPQGFGSIPVPLTVVVDGSASLAYMLTVR
jgi:hypothetical protein